MIDASKRRLCAAAAACAAILAVPAHAGEDAYPDQPVRVIVPFPPGAGVDITTRLIMAKLSTDLGKSFIIENYSGAGGNVGAGMAARAAPDGYTLLAAPSSIAVGQALYPNLPFNAEKDLTAIAMMASVPFVLVTRPGLPVKSVADLVALAKAHPGSLTFASTGNGSSPYLAAVQFDMAAHVQIRHIPYRGTAQAMTDLIANRVDIMFANALSVLPQVKAGSLKALAVTSAQPSEAAPGLPTMEQAGVAGYQTGTWFALMGPAGMPPAIVTRLNEEIAKIVAMPDVHKALLLQGATAGHGSPAQVQAFVASEIHNFTRIVKVSGAHIN